MFDFLKEPIKRKIFVLVAIFFSVFLVSILAEEASRRIHLNYDKACHNQFARSDLGEIILKELLKIELELKGSTSIRDLRGLEISEGRVSDSIEKIQGVLGVLLNGGDFEEVIHYNLLDMQDIRERISFSRDKNTEYVIEVIDLTPKIVNIEQIAADIVRAAADKFNAAGEQERLLSEKKLSLLLKQAGTLLLRSRECANRISYETYREIERLENKMAKVVPYFVLGRYLVLAIAGVVVIVVFILTILQVGGIIEERREANETVQTIMDTVPAGIAVIDADSHEIMDINKSALKMIGASRENIVGAVCHKCICPAEVGQCPITDLGQEIDNSERILLTADGVEIDILKSAAPVTLGDRRCLVESFIDISELKRAQNALRESEEKFKNISANAQDAIIMMDGGERVSYWNRAAEEMFGWSEKEALGRDLHSFLVPERYFAAFKTGFARFRNTGQGPAVGKVNRLTAIRRNGAEFPIELSLASVKLKGEWRAIGIMRDVTETMEAEKRLTQAREKAEKSNRELEQTLALAKQLAKEADLANAAKSEFLANMSHEIRTPMNGVIGMTGLLLDTDLTSEQREYAEVVGSCADSLLMLINDILDFSKIEAGKLDLEILDFDLRTTLEDTNDALALKAYEKGLEYAYMIKPDVPSLLQGDPGRLRQILTNLINNAIKFTSEGEVVLRVDLKKEDDDRAEICFTISDTGSGIPANKVKILFEAFTQADASTTRKHGGTGLGLTISRQLAELMGGRIGVESEEGKGSVFWFTAALKKQPADRKRLRDLPVNIQDKRILVVDDNATNRRILAKLLQSWHCRCDEAQDAKTALKMLRAAATEGDPFHIALLDMLMPEMDGETLGKKIKEDSLLREMVFLVMITSVGKRGDVARLEKVGFSAYLTKPVKQSQLYDCLATILSRKTDVVDAPERPIVTRHSIAENRKRKIRILLAEDNIVNQKVALKILEKLGYRADAVANGREAVEVLEMIPYDLVLMDVQMPEMDGLEATRMIRDKSSAVRNHEIPIIAMTAHAMKGDRERCLDAGMDDYVPKPVQPKILEAAINKWIAGKVSYKAEMKEDAAPREQKVFDRSDLVERLAGDEDLIGEIMGLFLEDAPCRIAGIKDALKNNDASQVRFHAHSLKGTSANISAYALQATAYEAEKAGESDDMEGVAVLIGRIEDEFEKLKRALSDLDLPT